jgi:DNA end-binding protein Ku
MAALRQSVAEGEREDKAKVAGAAKSKKAGKRNPDQREMLLPIAGSGKGKEAAKEAEKKAECRARST